jgi:hypothetical protein
MYFLFKLINKNKNKENKENKENIINYKINIIDDIEKIDDIYDLDYVKNIDSSFDLNYYKNFNYYQNDPNDFSLINHFIKNGKENNENYNTFDYNIDNYINRLNESNPLYHRTLESDKFRTISTFSELENLFYLYKIPRYYIYNEESFYKLYPDFDINYYKNKYFNNDNNISNFELLKHYHLTGKYLKYCINNKIKIIIYTRPFDILCGGIIALHNLAKIINDLNHPIYYAKLFVYNNLKYKNIFCNNFANIDEIDDNTIVVYPEIIQGNPLNCKNVIRWILLELGIEMPHDHYLSWGLTSLESGVASDGTNNLIYHWETNKYKSILCCPWFNINFIYKNIPKTKTCYMIKKGYLIHKNIKFFHKEDSILIDNLNISEKNDIFNESTYFYCYDTKSAYAIFAISCGCIPIIYPIENVSKEEYFKSTALYKDNKIYNAGIAYGIDDLEHAHNTKLEGINMYRELFDSYKSTVISALDDIGTVKF